MRSTPLDGDCFPSPFLGSLTLASDVSNAQWPLQMSHPCVSHGAIFFHLQHRELQETTKLIFANVILQFFPSPSSVHQLPRIHPLLYHRTASMLPFFCQFLCHVIFISGQLFLYFISLFILRRSISFARVSSRVQTLGLNSCENARGTSCSL